MSDKCKCGNDHGHGHHHHHGEQECKCGNDHAHHGHGHHHHHGEGCCCHNNEKKDITLNEAQKDFLKELIEKDLPVANFIIKSSKEDAFEVIGLSAVVIEDIKDSMEKVKAQRDFLKELDALDLIILDYDTPLDDFDYSIYENSELFSMFAQTVEEGKGKSDDFYGDIACIEKGSILLTVAGAEFVIEK